MRTRQTPFKRSILRCAILLTPVVLLTACCRTQHASVDAPGLSFALRWVGTCAVICSALAGTALVIASRNRKG